MNSHHVINDLENALSEQPLLDIHTHLVDGKLTAQGLHDVLLYHMVISDLYSAGCPSGARLTQYPGFPSNEEASDRIQEALPYIPFIRNTSMNWILKTILADLYQWNEPINAENWKKLDGMIRERSGDANWVAQLMSLSKIKRSVTEIARRSKGENDSVLQYSLEWGFFTRCQWGEYDTALYELERCWGKRPESPSPIGSGSRPMTDRNIRNLDDVNEAVHDYVANIPFNNVISTATHISTDIDFSQVSDQTMANALLHRSQAGIVERNIYASYVNEAFLSELEKHGKEIVFQFSFGAEPLPYETGSRLSQNTIAQVGEMIARHPDLKFQCFLSNRHANQSMCTLARELPNFSLAGYWWHNFFPDTIQQVMAERLDMLPLNKQIGFFSDAYCLEWSYGKAKMIRKILARVLAEKIELGQYNFEDALSIAASILYESPQTINRMLPF